MSDGLTPIVVASSGRSGTTTVMQLLGSSCEVAFDRLYAYEHAYLSYFMQLADTPESGAMKHGGTGRRTTWRRAALDNANFVRRHGFVAGIPWKERPIIDQADGGLADELLVGMWSVFSRHARAYSASLCDDGAEASYYAETAPMWVADRARSVLDGRTIYLVRDPRDQWVSIMAFNERRGYPSFGYQPDDTPETYAASFIERQRAFLRRVASVVEGPREAVVPFEEMVLERGSLARRLSEWLDVELTAEVVDDHAEDHKTAASTRAAVGRWRTDMPEHIIAMFRNGLSDEVDAMGWDWE